MVTVAPHCSLHSFLHSQCRLLCGLDLHTYLQLLHLRYILTLLSTHCSTTLPHCSTSAWASRHLAGICAYVATWGRRCFQFLCNFRHAMGIYFANCIVLRRGTCWTCWTWIGICTYITCRVDHLCPSDDFQRFGSLAPSIGKGSLRVHDMIVATIRRE